MNNIYLIKWGGKASVVVMRDASDLDASKFGDDLEIWEIGYARLATPPGPMLSGTADGLTHLRPLGVPINERAGSGLGRPFSEND